MHYICDHSCIWNQAARMIPMTWILVALCFAPYIQCLQPESAACETALSHYKGLGNPFGRVASGLFRPILDHASAQGELDDICMQLNLSAQAVENVISQCTHSSEQCRSYRSSTLTPDVLGAFANLCRAVQTAEYMQQYQMLATCFMSLDSIHRRWVQATANEGEKSEMMRINRLATAEGDSFFENSTVACGFGCGRQCTCRRVQIGVPLQTEKPSAHIQQVCGQKEQDLITKLQDRVFDALNCSEFGDYIKEWGWLKVNFQVNQTTPALHR